MHREIPEGILTIDEFEHPFASLVTRSFEKAKRFQNEKLSPYPIHCDIDISMKVGRVDSTELDARDCHRHLKAILIAEHALRMLTDRK